MVGRDDGNGDGNGAFVTRLALTAAAVILGVVHVVWPRARIDTITVVLLLIAVLPWLHRLFKSVQTPFLGVEYREFERRLDAVSGKAESSRRLVEANEARDLARRVQRNPDKNSTLVELIEEYDGLRKSMRSGGGRTNLMTSLVGGMIAAIEQGAEVDVGRTMRSDDPGERLAAYVALYAYPAESKAIALVDSLVDVEDTRFGQYWALQSLRRILEAQRTPSLTRPSRRKLHAYRERLERGSDRAYELDRILRLLG